MQVRSFPMDRRTRFWGLAALLVVSPGCNWFDDPTPEFVQVMIDGDTGPLLVVTSTQFIPTTNEAGEMGVQVYAADTTAVSFPFEHTWNIKDQNRFLLYAFPADSSTVMVRLRVFLDGTPDYDNTLGTSVEDPIRYIYLFNQEVIPDFDLL